VARIVVCGYMVRHPLGGNVLAYFHYVLGFHRLGHEVVYLEESGWSDSCFDPVKCDYGDDPQAGLNIVRALLAAYGLDVPVIYVNRKSGRVEGADRDEVRELLEGADLVLNVGGVCWLPEFRRCSRRALIDMDPLFTQIGQFGMEGRDDYHAYFTYGVNIGKPWCTIPSAGVDWILTVPPVVPEIWYDAERPQAGRGAGITPADSAFTTVANWKAYGVVTYHGKRYGQKQEEFLRLLNLPSHTAQTLELALAGVGSEDQHRLRAAGWSVRDAGEVSADVRAYMAYIAGSRGEFSAAKHAYVKTRSGWFSDRSVCYLAAGLPVILQNTGFTDWLHTDHGVLAFSSVEEAADCLERVDAEYQTHCDTARVIAERHFSYRAVLPALLDRTLAKGVDRGQVAFREVRSDV
jgi:hypothetical protein